MEEKLATARKSSRLTGHQSLAKIEKLNSLIYYDTAAWLKKNAKKGRGNKVCHDTICFFPLFSLTWFKFCNINCRILKTMPTKPLAWKMRLLKARQMSFNPISHFLKKASIKLTRRPKKK